MSFTFLLGLAMTCTSIMVIWQEDGNLHLVTLAMLVTGPLIMALSLLEAHQEHA